MKLRRPKSCTWSTATTTQMKKCPMSYACHAKSDESPGLGPHLYTRESARLSVLAGLLLVLARLLRLFLFYILASTQVHSTLLFQYPTWSVCSACVRRWTRITRTSLAPQTNPFPTPTPHDQCAVPLCASEHKRLWHPNPNATWSVCSACVRKWTWTLVAPQPQRHMISVQCLCAQVNMNACGTPTPTPHDQCAVPVCVQANMNIVGTLPHPCDPLCV